MHSPKMSSTFSFENNDRRKASNTTMMMLSPKPHQLGRGEEVFGTTQEPEYRTPCDRHSDLPDGFTLAPLPAPLPLLGRQEPDSEANPLPVLDDINMVAKSSSSTEVISTPADLTSLVMAMRVAKVEDSPAPMIPELLNLLESCDFNRPSLSPGHRTFPGLCRPSLRPKGEVLRSKARRTLPRVNNAGSGGLSQKDRKLEALLKSLPQLPDSACLMREEGRTCPSLKPRMMLR